MYAVWRRYLGSAYADILLGHTLSICRTEKAAATVISTFANPDQANAEGAVLASAIWKAMYAEFLKVNPGAAAGTVTVGAIVDHHRERMTSCPLARLTWEYVMTHVARVSAVNAAKHGDNKTLRAMTRMLAWLPPACGAFNYVKLWSEELAKEHTE